MNSKPRMAILIDADNTPIDILGKALEDLSKLGEATIKRAYGNWASDQLKNWPKTLGQYAIQPYQQFDLTKGKNATDIAMTIDAMDILHSNKVNAFCLITSDCDFTPLATRIRAEGKTVIGIGARKTPASFIRACSQFFFLKDQTQASETPSTATVNSGLPPNRLKGDTRLMNALRNAIRETADSSGWAKLSTIGSRLSQDSLKPAHYGYGKLSELVEQIDLFQMKRGPAKQWLVKEKDR